ncbi:hypothetical protein FRB96_000808 [Tulasnella sp. 330]|nr:hypothetical protein FRB96_000808 [Tulasnella sp. 330]KAG8872679.1 hypothetical protein FRB97_007434 [Tulasnella sp. 331]
MDSLAIELLHHIAYFAAIPTSSLPSPITPPSSLLSLLSVCRAWHASLNSRDHPHLYARIFRATFDSSALYRRFHRPCLTAPSFTIELIRRWNSLKRIRYFSGGGGLGSGISGASQVGWQPRRYKKSMVLEDLMTMYIMLIENDGRNVGVLKDYAGVEAWLDRYRSWRMIKMHSETSRMPEDSDETSLFWWVEWLLMDPNKCVMEQDDLRRQMIWLLTPYALGTFKYPLSYAPWPYQQLPLAPPPNASALALPNAVPTATELSPMHIQDHTPSPRPRSTAFTTYFGSQHLPISNPLLHHAATQLFLARKQAENPANHQGIVNNIQFPGNVCDSRVWDLEWERLSGCQEPLAVVQPLPMSNPGLGAAPAPMMDNIERTKGSMHVPGSLTGEWNGWFSIMTPANYETLMTSSDDPNADADGGSPLNVLEDVWLLQDVQSWHIEEHHLRPDVLSHCVLPFNNHGSSASGGNVLGAAGHPLNAHIPSDLEIVGQGSQGRRRVWCESERRWMDGIVVVRRGNKRAGGGGREFFYETIRPGTSTHRPPNATSFDGSTPNILVTGFAIPSPITITPPSATNPLPTYTSTQSRFMPAPTSTLFGTVRAWDGLVTLRARDGSGVNGSFVWNGYLSGSGVGDGGNWVGQWRDGEMDVGRRAWEGVYTMRKRSAASVGA